MKTHTEPRVRVGLTGGIGSGKSTVAGMLQRLGAVVVDADALSRASTAAGGPAIAAIRAQFGEDFITPDGAMDRDRMRALVFSDPSARARLEAIIHPIVRQQMNTLSTSAAGGCLVLDLPLLAEEQHRRPDLDCIWVVDCQPETQVARVMQRNGWSREQVLAVMATQASREQRLSLATTVIDNDHLTLEQLQTHVQQAYAELRQRFGL